MKTKPMQHQKEALRRSEGRTGFAYFMEQGTGKTWTALADAERAYAQGLIDAVFVLAPKGVHTNWIRREIPTHLSVPAIARAWTKTGGQKTRRALEELFRPREDGEPVPLRVLSMNFDALNTKDGFDMAKRFLSATKPLVIVDESSRIKNPTAARTKKLMELRKYSAMRRILTGTPITNSPPDIFAQMEFLSPGLLGTTSYRVFVAEYSELLDESSAMYRKMVEKNPRIAKAQIIARDESGRPKYKNLDKLRGKLEPHSFRVLKRDCLDLPEKIYSTHFFELEPRQRAAYDLMQQECRVEIVPGEVVPVHKLAAIVKLQQITSGYIVPPPSAGEGFEPVFVTDGNPRLDAFTDLMEDIEGSVIVWAKFRPELDAICKRLREMELSYVRYDGSISAQDREAAVDDFQAGRARVFVGQAQAGGIGLTLTRAETSIYYSQDYNLETRLQSEDRNHRIGTRNNVRYIDLAAVDTIDEDIASVLQSKTSTAKEILGDNR